MVMKGQILLIDDNMLDIKIMSSVLERKGYFCHGMVDHKKALEWLVENTPQYIFLDIQMPGITGYELIAMIKNMPHLAPVQIIMVSGKNQSEDVMKAIKLGATDYIVKPIDPLVLQEKITKIDNARDNDFYSVDLENSSIKASFSRPLSIVSVSEFGVTVTSAWPIPAGEVLNITGLSVEEFGAESLLLRSLSCELIQSKQEFKIQMTFTGMVEAQRQVIRKYCRQAWRETKKGAG